MLYNTEKKKKNKVSDILGSIQLFLIQKFKKYTNYCVTLWIDRQSFNRITMNK